MGAEYTPEQHTAVVRVMKLKVTDYYGILMVERKCTAIEVKKAYRKLAVVVHPDKNKAPDADEAFKRVSKSFQVLSDETKRKLYDQTGADPDSRSAGYGPGPGAGAGSPFGGSPFGGSPFGGSPFGGQRFQRAQYAGGDDIFNMFFGGAPGPQPQFQFHFGSPQGSAFGGGQDIFSALFGDAFGAATNRAGTQRRQQQQQSGNESNIWLNLLVVVALVLISPLASWLTGSDPLPKFRFDSASPYTQEIQTPKYHIPFYVNPKEVADLSASKQRRLQREAENQFVARTRSACSAEYMDRQERMQAATGWFSRDEELYEAAKSMSLPHCDLLNSFGIRLQQ